YDWYAWREGETRELYERSAFVVPVVWALVLVAGGSIRHDDNEVSGQFGYQRGDFIEAIDGTAKDAWLWFYGNLSVGHSLEEIPGLDLVDNDDGLIQPDGIPDGIVVLYKLKEGKVIEERAQAWLSRTSSSSADQNTCYNRLSHYA
ncbi:MAG: hypothetical protein B1H03_06495, partial [Planctomycetales bacterium 4484_113]